MFGPMSGSVSQVQSLLHGAANLAPTPVGCEDPVAHEGKEAQDPPHIHLLHKMEPEDNITQHKSFSPVLNKTIKSSPNIWALTTCSVHGTLDMPVFKSLEERKSSIFLKRLRKQYFFNSNHHCDNFVSVETVYPNSKVHLFETC